MFILREGNCLGLATFLECLLIECQGNCYRHGLKVVDLKVHLNLPLAVECIKHCVVLIFAKIIGLFWLKIDVIGVK